MDGARQPRPPRRAAAASADHDWPVLSGTAPTRTLRLIAIALVALAVAGVGSANAATTPARVSSLTRIGSDHRAPPAPPTYSPRHATRS